LREAWRRLQARRRTHLRVQQLDARVETRTEDGVPIEMTIDVHYYEPVPYPILPKSAYEVYDDLERARQQITACMVDVVTARVSKMKWADLETTQDVAELIKSDLAQVMEGSGREILEVFVREIKRCDAAGPSANDRAAVARWEGEGGGS
jgi:hypothetical protein